MFNRQPRQQDRRGAAMVEMAFVLPIFLLVVLGIIEFGRAMMVGQLVTNASREGARLAILDGSTNSQVEQAIRDFLQASLNVSGDAVNVTITITPAPGNSTSGNSLSDAQSRDLITVRVEVPFGQVNYIPSKHLQNAMLVGQTSMRHE
jgi:Flp pilus assembly protein TadG